jgi:RNA recognition motif-containing protein
MADDESENRAIDGLQGAELMGRPLRINKAEPRTGGGGGGHGGGAPRRVNGGGYGGAAAGGGVDRPSGASGWEDRSYGSGDSFGEGRSRRRRSSGPQD